jgi:hypothetical protein
MIFTEPDGMQRSGLPDSNMRHQQSAGGNTKKGMAKFPYSG